MQSLEEKIPPCHAALFQHRSGLRVLGQYCCISPGGITSFSASCMEFCYHSTRAIQVSSLGACFKN